MLAVSLQILFAAHLFGEESSLPQRILKREVYRDTTGEHKYVVSLPPGYSTARRWPILLFLHGAGERGQDGELQLSVGLGPMLYHDPEFPFVVVFPQCEDTEGRYLTGWLADSPNGQRAISILHEVEQNYSIDTSQRVLCGWSMGGYGTWSQAAAHPELWSAVLALAGGGAPGIDLSRLAELRVPVWAVHGSNDSLIPVHKSREVVDALKAQGGRVSLTELASVDHDVWRPVFRQPAVTQWLLDPDSIVPEKVEWEQVVVEANTRLCENAPFVPQSAIRRGIGIRLGNEALATLSEGVPAAIPPESLTGTLDEVVRQVGTGSDHVSLRLSGGNYTCRVSGCSIKAVSGGWVHVRFDLSPVELSFEQTEISGQTLAARTGPFQVVLGHRRPVSLEIDLRPEIQGGLIRLVPLRQDFELASDNWYVSRPETIQVSQGKYTADNIASGIVGGLYLNKEAIIEQVYGVIPGLLKTTEQRLNEIDGSRTVSQFLWPLPFLAPRLKLEPCELRTDAEGVSLLLDVLIAHHELQSAEPVHDLPVTQVNLRTLVTPQEIHNSGIDGHSRNVCLLTSLDLVRALSDSVVRETRVYVNVLDVPVEEVSRLGNPQILRPLFPDLTDREDELRVNISLDKAFEIQVISATADEAQLQVSTSGIRLSVQEFQEGHWRPVVAMTYRLEQGMSIREAAKISGGSAIQIHWQNNLHLVPITVVLGSDPACDLTSNSMALAADDLHRINSLSELFQEGWRAWIETLPSQTTEIPSLTLGDSQLVWLGLGWEQSAADQQETPDLLRVSFGAPPATIQNVSSEAIIYEVRGSLNQWSGPYFLPAKSEHKYRAGYPLRWRLLNHPTEISVIPVGGSLSLDDARQVNIKMAK